MLTFNCFVLFCAVFSLCDSAFVDTLKKCHFSDGPCLKEVVQGVLESIAEPGIPEYGIPPLDPLKVDNMKFNIMNLAEITINDGVLKGIKHCKMNEAKLNMEKRHFTFEIICDVITAKGKYDIAGSGTALKDLFGGGALKGNGNAKVKIEKLKINAKLVFDVVKRSDGEIYFQCNKDKGQFDFDVQGNSHLKLDHLLIGDVESSKIISDYYNQNYKTVWKSFGKQVFASVKDIIYDWSHRFFGKVPAKYYLDGDLTPYVNN